MSILVFTHVIEQRPSSTKGFQIALLLSMPFYYNIDEEQKLMCSPCLHDFSLNTLVSLHTSKMCMSHVSIVTLWGKCVWIQLAMEVHSLEGW